MSSRHYRADGRATRWTPRAINEDIILGLLRSHREMSRAELARRLAMQRSGVGQIVADLVARGLVTETRASVGRRGRPPRLLRLDTRERCAVAVDVRIARSHVALTDLMGQERSPVRSFPTGREPAQLVERLAWEVRRLLADHPEAGACQGVGVAFPGILDRAREVVIHAPTLGWKDVPLREPLSRALGIPVTIDTTVKAWALAQLWALRGESAARDVVFVVVSDGVGVGAAAGGELLRGRHNVAGEFGHVPLNVDGPRCACGATGCWEVYVSNLATVSRYLGTPLTPEEPLPPRPAGVGMETVLARAREGDAAAQAALRATAHYLGLGLGSIVNALDPDQIYVGGEIASAWDLVEPTVRAALAQRVLVAAAAQVRLTPAPPDQRPRLRGAASLVGVRILGAKTLA